jgi:hypothetical protein
MRAPNGVSRDLVAETVIPDPGRKPKGDLTLRNRRIRSRSFFSLESLEIRTAPSHVSALAHALPQVHHVQPTVHVEKIHDTKATESNQSVETKTGVDPSPDSASTSFSKDSSPNDNSVKDPTGQS